MTVLADEPPAALTGLCDALNGDDPKALAPFCTTSVGQWSLVRRDGRWAVAKRRPPQVLINLRNALNAAEEAGVHLRTIDIFNPVALYQHWCLSPTYDKDRQRNVWAITPPPLDWPVRA